MYTSRLVNLLYNFYEENEQVHLITWINVNDSCKRENKLCLTLGFMFGIELNEPTIPNLSSVTYR